MEAGLTLRLCLAILRAAAHLVPQRDRDAWLQEWEAELRERWDRLARRNELGRRQQVDLLRRILGSFHDAAWLRRQFTRDAEIVHDMRHGFRVLRRSPGFALLAILVLGLGTGATVGIFSVVDTLLMRPLPYRDADRIVMLWQGSENDPELRDDPSPANFLDWREQLRSFEAIAAVEPWTFDYTGGGEPESVKALMVTPNFFSAIGAEPTLGRTFTAEEFLPGRNRVIVISHGVWQTIFGGAADIIGRSVMLNGTAYTVVGVMPEWYQPRLLQSQGERGVMSPKIVQEFERRIRGGGYWQVVARLRPGISIDAAQAELAAVSAGLARQYPRTNTGVVARAQPLRDHLAANLRPALRLLFLAVAMLLLIAAANVANLLLARASHRAHEIAVRSAIGAGRARLVRQLLAESLLLAMLGSAAGLLVAAWTVRLITRLSPANVPILSTVSIDARVMTFAIVLTSLVALIVGIMPAWHSAGGKLVMLLRRTAGATGGARHRLRATIVVAEVALALLLMTGAGLLVRSFAAILAIDPGFRPEPVVALQVFTWGRGNTPEKRAAFIAQVQERMASLPVVERVGAVSAMPFIESNINMETALFLPERPVAAGEEPSAFLTIATPGYFEAMGMRVREGRALEPHDGPSAARVAVVSESLAQRAWPDGRALGRRFSYRYQGQQQQAEVVGIVADVRHDALDRPARPELFVPHQQAPFGSMTFVARVNGDPGAAINALKAEIRAVNPLQTIYRAATATELVSRTLVERRLMLALLSGFAAIAALLAAIGIYGVISVATTQRTREFGVRIALGAERTSILTMVLREGVVMTAIGLTLGLAGAVALGHAMRGFLFGIAPTDPATLAAAVGALAAVALLACVVPARRATRVDPLVALRAE